jgi:hypothetical protein
MQIDFLGIAVIIFVIVWAIIAFALHKRMPSIRMSNIVVGLLTFVVVAFAAGIYVIASIIGTAGLVIGTDKLPGIIIMTVLVVGIRMMLRYLWIMRV